jgi:hypothetical protein
MEILFTELQKFWAGLIGYEKMLTVSSAIVTIDL